MALTGSQIITEVADVVGKALTGTSRSGAALQDRILKYLNWTQQRIARHFSFEELNAIQTGAATVADIKRYPLSTGTNNLGLTKVKDIETMRLMDSENSRKLDLWSHRRFDKSFPRPENFASARPTIYVRYKREVELFKVPDAAYTLEIRYSKWATDMANDANVSEFLEKDDLLVVGTIMEAYMALEEYADARIYFQRFLGILANAVSVEGLVDWEPEAIPHGALPSPISGSPWLDPYGTPNDPLFFYPE